MKKDNQTIEIQEASSENEINRIQNFFNSDPIEKELHIHTFTSFLVASVAHESRQLIYTEDCGKITSAAMVCCRSLFKEDSEAEIPLIATDPEYRRQGLATELVKHGIKFALKQDILLMKIQTLTGEAVEFGESCGFSPRRLQSGPNGQEVLVMTRDVKRPFGVIPSDPPFETSKTTNDNIDEVRL